MSVKAILATCFFLLAPTAMGAGTGLQQLPTTGAEVAGVALLGLILIAVGIVLMRRRGRNRTDGPQQ